MSSIRRFLVIVLLATITLVNFLAALHGYRSSMGAAEKQFDQQLTDIAGVLATTIDAPQAAGLEQADKVGLGYQIWQDGALLDTSGNLPAEPLTPFEVGFREVNFGGYRWRTYTEYVPATEHWLIVAERQDIRFSVAEGVIVESILPVILGLPVICLLVWIIVSRGLSPLRDLADAMRAKRSEDLSAVEESEPPEELAVLINSFNDLLARLDASFTRERQLAADAAHELRTPITILKVELHNLLEDAEHYRPELEHLESCVERMEHSIAQVLMLYRTSPDQFIASFRETDLVSLARDVIAELYTQLSLKDQTIELVEERTMMLGDEFTLKSLLSNLISNASKYTQSGGQIRVTIRSQNDAVVLRVEDNGPGIPAAERERVFERFRRLDAGSANVPADGVGIGLAIVQHVADIHGAGIQLAASDFSSGLAVIVTFPNTQPTWAGLAPS